MFFWRLNPCSGATLDVGTTSAKVLKSWTISSNKIIRSQQAPLTEGFPLEWNPLLCSSCAPVVPLHPSSYRRATTPVHCPFPQSEIHRECCPSQRYSDALMGIFSWLIWSPLWILVRSSTIIPAYHLLAMWSSILLVMVFTKAYSIWLTVLWWVHVWALIRFWQMAKCERFLRSGFRWLRVLAMCSTILICVFNCSLQATWDFSTSLVIVTLWLSTLEALMRL